MKIPTALTLNTMYELLEATITQGNGTTIFVIDKRGANSLNVVLDSLTHIYDMKYFCYTKFWRPGVMYFRVEYKTWFTKVLQSIQDWEYAQTLFSATWEYMARKTGGA